MNTNEKTLSGKPGPLVVLGLALMLSGCAGAGQMTDIERPKAGQAVVFGSVTVLEDGKPQKWGMTWTGTREFRLLLLPKGETTAISYRLAKDGTFAWGLKPGEYSIAGYELKTDGQSRSARLWAPFTVPQESKSLYIGDLTLEMTGGLFHCDAEDRYDTAEKTFHAKFPGAPEPPGKAIVEIEHDVGSFAHRSHICNASWGLACSKTYHGVTPIRPEVVEGGFSTVGDLLPTFEWHPSTAADVTYDLVVYQAVAFTREAMQTRPNYIPGPVIAYQEGLKGTSWRPDAPLQPGHRYYWSIRLRRGDTVTNWTTYSYFHFYLVASSSGFGRLFGFATAAE